MGRTKLGTQILQRIGFNFCITHFLSLDADTCAKAGMIDEALAIIDTTLTMLAEGKVDDRTDEAEHHRLKGEMLLRIGLPYAES